MSLRIDLILESEQRSASLVNVKSVTRIAAIAGPLLLLLGIAWMVIRFMAVKNRERMREAEWRVAEPKYEEAMKLNAEMKTNREILKLVKGWRDSGLAWAGQLAALRDTTPAQIQLVYLKSTEDVRAADGKTKRFLSLQLQGKAIGTNAQENVDGLRGSLAEAETFKPFLEKIDVVEFKADTDKDADKHDRVFRIEGRYKPRVVE